jgi:peptide deformylase
MPIRPITITGTDVLHTKASLVAEFDEKLKSLIEDMFETMEKAPGVGLAAPQIGVGLSVFVYDWTDDDDVHHRGVAVNPELELFGSQEFDKQEHIEGCLSVPGLRYPLARSPMARLTALDEDGHKFTVIAKGWLARIFQHEFDHLQGTLYVDRLAEEEATEALKNIRDQNWPANSSWMPGVDYEEP